MTDQAHTEETRRNIHDHAAILADVLHQLKAMNCSAAHAASWVEPKADDTTKMIERIERALA